MHRRRSPLATPLGPAAIGLGSGILLLVAVFLPWYAVNLGPATEIGSASGWEWTAVAKGALGLAVIWTLASALLLADRLDYYRVDERTAEALGWLVAGCATLACGLVLFRLFRPPQTADFLTRDFGLFVSLVAAAIGVVAGVAQASRR